MPDTTKTTKRTRRSRKVAAGPVRPAGAGRITVGAARDEQHQRGHAQEPHPFVGPLYPVLVRGQASGGYVMERLPRTFDPDFVAGWYAGVAWSLAPEAGPYPDYDAVRRAVEHDGVLDAVFDARGFLDGPGTASGEPEGVAPAATSATESSEVVVWLAELQTTSFRLDAAGATQEAAVEALRRGWAVHRVQTGASWSWEQARTDGELSVRRLVLGGSYRDGEVLTGSA